MASILSQALIEYMELVALKNGARWNYHSHCYIDFQTSIQCAVETEGSFSALPGAFSSETNFFDWVANNRLTVMPIYPKLSDPAYITVGNTNSREALQGSSFLWVRAVSSDYRKVLLYWLNYLRNDKDLQELQRDAATVYDRVAKALQNLEIRKKITPNQRTKLISVFHTLARRCRSAATSKEAAVKCWHLLKPFDSTMDADHVINKASLKGMPDAIVLLAPVIASSNRGFGRAVEKYASQPPIGNGIISLNAATVFKLFAPNFPSTALTLQEQVAHFKKRFLAEGLDLEGELELVEKTLLGFVDGTSKSFSR